MAGAPAPPFRTQPRTPRNLTPVVSTCVVRPGRLGLGPDWRAGDSILGQPRFAFTRPAADPDNGATRSGAARAAMPAPPPTLLASWRLIRSCWQDVTNPKRRALGAWSDGPGGCLRRACDAGSGAADAVALFLERQLLQH